MCDHPKRSDGTCPTCEKIDSLKRPHHGTLSPDFFSKPMVWPIFKNGVWVYDYQN